MEDSRSETTGLPMYKDQLKSNDIIDSVFKTEDKKNKLVENASKGYRKFFDFIKDFGLLSMNFCLEMDLSCSAKARDKYYELLNVLPVNKNQKHLLVSNAKSIKKIDKILKILDEIPKKNYPESYLKIRNWIITDIRTRIR